MDCTSSCSEAFAVGGIVGLIVLIVLLMSAVLLIPKIFYLITLQKALARCNRANRSMEPAMVWLMLIPALDLVWHFFVVNAVADSLEKEFSERSIQAEPAPGKSIGLAMCILNACVVVPYMGELTALGGLVCWILYWVKIADCSSRITTAAPTLQAP